MTNMEQYVIKHGDRFGTVSRVISALGDYLHAAIWKQHTAGYCLTLICERRFNLKEWQAAQTFVDTIHPTSGGMGETLPYRIPAAIAHDFKWDD